MLEHMSAEILTDRLRQLEIENKKLTRQLNLANITIDRYRLNSITQENLSAALMTEKSRQETYMSLMLKNSPDIIFLLNSKLEFVFATDTLLKTLNLEYFGLIQGKTFRSVFDKVSNPEWLDSTVERMRDAVRRRMSFNFEEWLDLSGAGEMRDYTIIVTPVTDESGVNARDVKTAGADSQNIPDAVLVIFHDITELRNEKERAEFANRAKSDFLVTISHEIRTPMNAIMGISDMMKRTPLTVRQQEFLTNIQNSSTLLLNLINDILDFSKIEAGSLEMMEEFFHLPKLLNKIQSIFRIMFGTKSLRFVCSFHEDLPVVLFGDGKRLGQVLTNLLNNALKYTPQGCVNFRVFPRGDTICFEIEDTGIGIRENDIPRLFTAFEQLHRVDNKKTTGAGLGLAITKKLCEKMRGTIQVESEFGSGTTVFVTVPMIVGSEDDLKPEPIENFQFTAPKARLLVVDDIDINLMVAEAVLSEYEMQVDMATGGYQAIEKAMANRYDIIFMDHMMPDLDGIEATKLLRQTKGYTAVVPIVALTANAVVGAQNMFLDNGFNDYLTKPIDPVALNACLIRWLPKDLLVQVGGTA
ncbi:MAG: ATP-binding protein [Oscillospiraceae bacterium]|nr:ATP-binding protein [Oscillospiraceae bacterium]